MNKNKIVGIGEIVWDMLPSGKQLGGAPVNFAFYTQQLGARAGIVSAVGKDALGLEVLKIISDLDMDISAVQENKFPTGTVDVTISGDGIPSYFICEEVAWDYIQLTPETEEMVSDAAAVCWGSLAQRSEQSRTSIQAILAATPSNCLKVFDINIRLAYYTKDIIQQSLEHANVLKLNEDELPIVADLFGIEGDELAVIHHLIRQFNLAFVIYTKGAECSMIVDKDKNLSSIDTPRVPIADTVGAGDAFTAAFISAHLNGLPMDECHRLAVEIAAYVCTQHGAVAKLPKSMSGLN